MDLNLAQKEAVLALDGPVLVIAGAGTGKTAVIVSRILEIINVGRALDREILALTFTEKAASEMLDRVSLGLSTSYGELNIKTFHAFADQILREAGMEIGIDPGYKILTQSEQWFFFKKYLYEFELDYYRPLGNPNKFISSLLSHFSGLKDELIDPQKYLDFAETLADEEKQKTLEIARTYMKYQELLIKNNFLDFGDLCFYANRLLENRKSVLRSYQSRFKYFLVDEFQDTNFSQFQLVLKLAQESQKIMVVGDDDQSIYKWRGASLSNILQFQDYFPDGKKIVLTENYRSSQNILDGAYQLIKNNDPDRLEVKLGIQKKLLSKSADNEKIEIDHFPNYLQESSYVAEKIRNLQKEKGLEFSDFAVLIRSNQLANAFIDEFKNMGIPFQVRNPKGLFSLPEIKDLIALVRVVADPNDSISFLRLLKMDCLELKMQEILAVLNNPNNLTVFESLKALKQEFTLPGLEDPRLKIVNLVEELIEFSKHNSVGQLINEFIQKSGFLKFLVKNDQFEQLENINEFAKQVAKFERENSDNSPVGFVDYLDLLQEANAVFAADDFADRNSVQILTVHSAKGLEFKYVFIVNAVNSRFPSINRHESFEVPKQLANEIYPEGDFHIQEERRLFYVAMTRAKIKLFISYSDRYEGNKIWKASVFVNEILDCASVEKFEHRTIEDPMAALKKIKQLDKALFDLPKMKSKRLSYSQFDTFKTCPLKYNYRYILNIPTAQTHVTNFGTSMHEALKNFFRRLSSSKSPTFDDLESLYGKHWISAGYESSEQEVVKKAKGLEILREFYDINCKSGWTIPVFLEAPFNLRIGEHLVSGRIDRIDKLADGTYEVIDYKTGRFKDGLDLKKDLQLSIYALACEEVLKIKVSKLSLYYLDGNEKISTTRDRKQLSEVKNDILNLIEKMKVSDFAPTPGFHCQYCDFRLICPAV